MRHVRANDRWASWAATTTGEPRLGPVLGTWYNCNRGTGEVARLELAAQGDGLRLRAFGADESGPIDWGETPASPHVDRLGSPFVTGFTAHYDFGFMETQVAANIKYGVLVIQTYNRFLDGSGRPPYFTREFFHQRIGEPATVVGPADPSAASLPFRMASDRPPRAPAPGASQVDLAPLLGRWRNTYPESKGIASVVLSRGDDGFEVEAAGVGSDASWGRVPAIPHAPNVSSTDPAGFLARFDFGFSEVLFSANEAKGLLIIACFATFGDDSGRSSYFTREFFYRDDRGAETP